MYTDTIDLMTTNYVILKNKIIGRPIIISKNAQIEIEKKEIEALIENIIKEYRIEFKRKVKNNEVISI